ncbi:NAD(P)H-binding protein [Psychrosphaera sp. B3R10]|uniref:NAD(P)H-binding protein n=1 Tax=unclassified Psychrosphaera TaxID=2641570 RepID=UPI001C09C66C|nr:MULTISPECIES: NAD(P)H-binding protein [unclassified Psychrosphaera]MBU2880895.1 NAD(P)H-binding protein [Psychrosphaera sp. I2R16]MBU2990886.1 NAD(P)H-binding protein [Psychrosphaera sp. B3R10]
MKTATNPKRALVIGATGLVGQSLITQLLADEHYCQVISFSRSDLPANFTHNKLVQIKTDFDHLEAHVQDIVGDTVFCCLGTTIKHAGSQQAMIRVDRTYPVEFATLAKLNGATRLVFISSIGAKVGASSFYLNLKGETEHQLLQLGFDHSLIVRPSVLVGPRPEKRIGETFGKYVLTALQFIPFIGQYKPITADTVSRAMCQIIADQKQSVTIAENRRLQSFKKPED